MDSCSNSSTKSTTPVKPSFKDAGTNNENEMNPDMVLKSKVVITTKKNIAGKSFMSPTISAANKKKILTERNENSDVAEQNSVEWSSSFGSKAVKSPVVGDVAGLKPYDPVKNYLSPRPKFLRYNPNRRRKMFKENDDISVRFSTNSLISAGCGLELGVGSLGTTDSSAQKESVERDEKVIDEGDESEDDEEDLVEYEEDSFWSLKGLLKWSLVVVALVLMTQGICSVNSPTGSDTFVNRAVGLNLTEAEESINILMGFKDRAYVYGSASVDYSRIGTGPVSDADFEARKFEKVEVNMVENGLIDDAVVENVEESAMVENGLIDETDVTDDTSHLQMTETSQEIAESEGLEFDDGDFSQDVVSAQLDEAVNDETDVIQDDMWSKLEDTNHLQQVDVLQEHESADTEVMKTESASSDPAVTVLAGLVVLLLTSLGAIYQSKRTKSAPAVKAPAKKDDLKQPEPSPNPSSLIQHKEEQTLVTSAASASASASMAEPEDEVSIETSHINAPSVELLGEFVFGEEVTSSVRSYSLSPEANASNSLIQTTSLSFSQTTTSHVEVSTGDSRTARKPRRKTAESSSLVTPSSVRRSSRIQSRSSVMSP